MKFLLFFTCAFLFRSLSVEALDPDATKTFQELVESHNFTLLTYNVTTADGYINTVHRVVPPGYNETTYSKSRKPVIIFHGVLCQSPIFYMNSPYLTTDDSECGDNFGFGIVLTGRYDLWVPNARGNGISMSHVDYSSDDPMFWEFSVDQIAYYDIPAFIELVREETGHDTVGYIGYSQGGGTAFALLASRPEYAQYIEPLITWAPAAFMGNTTTAVKDLLLVSYPAIQAITGEFIITEEWFNDFGTEFCTPWLTTWLCSVALQAAMGVTNSINETRIPVYLHFFPSPGSNWQVGWFSQGFQRGTFSKFDYLDIGKNEAAYGQATPPAYQLGNIWKNITTIVMYGATDAVVVPDDNLKLINALQANGVDVTAYEIEKDVWSHFDFVTGQDAGRLVYDKTIEYLDQYVIKDGPQ